ncbi:peptide chain release factor N(5)-glutamine methyltransferase [Methylobrevis sp. L22]|uniref:Release factor glutamine methyltransferase n=1 Tax=Methylobrevis albus TaxID=2793297 RepID=A0A931I0Z0_9HYPH|nr:peptide chain release factor N(5)-glutamine methyltransferase [Methylobrevis albus]
MLLPALLAAQRRRLAEAGIDTASLDIRLLAGRVLGVDAAGLLAHDGPLGAAAAADITAMVDRRLAGEPVARILGDWEFWGLPFVLSPATLVPRPDTETLVEAVLDLVRGGAVPGAGPDGAGLTVVDLGTGSGAILVALLSELGAAEGLGVDLSEEALSTARLNAARNGVAGRSLFCRGSWLDAVTGPFSLVVSNPPYIESADIDGLAPEVARHDPRLALDGGADGLDAYRVIAAGAAARLVPGGVLALEIGWRQAVTVTEILADAGFAAITVRRDLAGHDRVVIGRRR